MGFPGFGNQLIRNGLRIEVPSKMLKICYLLPLVTIGKLRFAFG